MHPRAVAAAALELRKRKTETGAEKMRRTAAYPAAPEPTPADAEETVTVVAERLPEPPFAAPAAREEAPMSPAALESAFMALDPQTRIITAMEMLKRVMPDTGFGLMLFPLAGERRGQFDFMSNVPAATMAEACRYVAGQEEAKVEKQKAAATAAADRALAEVLGAPVPGAEGAVLTPASARPAGGLAIGSNSRAFGTLS
jgi:hypothetical protein